MPRLLEIVEWENFNDGRNDKNVQDSSLDRAKNTTAHELGYFPVQYMYI